MHVARELCRVKTITSIALFRLVALCMYFVYYRRITMTNYSVVADYNQTGRRRRACGLAAVAAGVGRALPQACCIRHALKAKWRHVPSAGGANGEQSDPVLESDSRLRQGAIDIMPAFGMTIRAVMMGGVSGDSDNPEPGIPV